jgi:cellulose biosynthesis protein BcsQ
MKTIAFFNNKGGVGKTSMAYHLAWMFRDIGHSVLAVDLDPQSNLTSIFLEESEIEKLWPEGNHPDTILGSINPLIERLGDLQEPKPIRIERQLHLIAGDLGLSTFEDRLSEAWSKCLDDNAPTAHDGFRVVTAFHRVMKAAAEKHESELVLIDVGPNIGAMNRAALVAADFVVIPLGADLFSLQGLRNRRKLYLETFGCQMNVLDSELVLGQLLSRPGIRGAARCRAAMTADVILYNTCSVREHAEQKVWSRLGELRPRKAADPGWSSASSAAWPSAMAINLFKRHPHVDILCGPGELDKLPVWSTTPAPRRLPVTAARAQRQVGADGQAPAGARSATLAAAEDHLECSTCRAAFRRPTMWPRLTCASRAAAINSAPTASCPTRAEPEVHRPPQISSTRCASSPMPGCGGDAARADDQSLRLPSRRRARDDDVCRSAVQIHEAVPHLPRLRFVTSFPRDFTTRPWRPCAIARAFAGICTCPASTAATGFCA